MSIYQRIAVIFVALFSLSVWAQNDKPTADDAKAFQQKLSDITIKPYHQPLAATGRDASCQLCHGAKTPTTPANDSNCLTCHGSLDQIAAMTEPKSKEGHPEPNPHNSIHYGKDVPCSTCHSEHKPSQVYCNSCHLFKYPNMKP
ncbi:cytochrome c3 family protein [Budviciaceae bacterium CWB-B4]|uniref:Cytochrome c3 family protein n=1 Tax=Limnobaculum xujianqingii TaxID=2738837 RepID=A0A9D7FQ76_9GAMM|nr:cytochrome c3 family protein [Limnobaculum xujianqingii]MBK5071475.1 cytochrome c3 family protein [Limnobaculum xujianqingii]MBK5174784.1 cytochrome c3 family protein [Limnobaculum xujianqingii]